MNKEGLIRWLESYFDSSPFTPISLLPFIFGALFTGLWLFEYPSSDSVIIFVVGQFCLVATLLATVAGIFIALTDMVKIGRGNTTNTYVTSKKEVIYALIPLVFIGIISSSIAYSAFSIFSTRQDMSLEWNEMMSKEITKFTGPFNEKLRDVPYRSGKVLILNWNQYVVRSGYNKPEKKIDKNPPFVVLRRYNELLDPLIRASSPEEVETVIWIEERLSQSGFSAGYRAKVAIVDLSIPAIIYRDDFFKLGGMGSQRYRPGQRSPNISSLIPERLTRWIIKLQAKEDIYLSIPNKK